MKLIQIKRYSVVILFFTIFILGFLGVISYVNSIF